ncbi:MAG: hypothetical protein ACTS41_00845 [Candidatus Hodgkinia cicadicola]
MAHQRMLTKTPFAWQVGSPPSATQTMRETTQLMRLTNVTLLPAVASMVCIVADSCFRRRNSLARSHSASALLNLRSCHSTTALNHPFH